MPDIPKGFDTSSCSETTLPIGSAMTGRGLCKIGVSRVNLEVAI